jgi:hypothetical protein
MLGKDENTRSSISSDETVEKPRRHLLTEFLPDPGYFLAGGVAGVVSRTATAPLDRLKVYLIAQTGATNEAVQAVKSGATNEAIQAVKSGAPLQASKLAARPLVKAFKALWGMGGIKSMFAGGFRIYRRVSMIMLTPYRQWPQRHQSHAGISHQVWLI